VNAKTSGWGLTSVPGLARQGGDERADEQFRIFIYYIGVYVFAAHFLGTLTGANQMSVEY